MIKTCTEVALLLFLIVTYHRRWDICIAAIIIDSESHVRLNVKSIYTSICWLHTARVKDLVSNTF